MSRYKGGTYDSISKFYKYRDIIKEPVKSPILELISSMENKINKKYGLKKIKIKK